jgi:TorA maturation chaperone TorD
MVTLQAPATADWQTAIAQGLVYGYLSRLFAYPDADRWSQLRDLHAPIVGTIEPSDEDLSERLQTTLAAVASTTLVEAQGAHQLLFPLVESQDCPAYETAYRSRDIWVQTDLMADAAGFYRAHGVRVGMPQPQRADHITVELEFMALLARKEAAALEREMPDGAAICRETGDAFLRDHLGCWGIGFGMRIEHVATAPYLVAAGRLLATWLEIELAVREVAPAERFDAPKVIDADDATEDDVAERCGRAPAAPQIIPLASLAAKRRLDR